MKAYQKDLWLAQILSGRIRCQLNKQFFYVAAITPQQRYEAQELYIQQLRNAELEDFMTDQQMVERLIDDGLWTLEEQKALDNVPKVIEQLKVQLYEAYRKFRSKHMRAIRKTLRSALQRFTVLNQRRHGNDMMTCEGMAGAARLEYMVICGIQNVSENPDIPDEDSTIKLLVANYLNAQVPEYAIREMARTEPWRGIWTVGKAEGSLLGVPSVMMTDEQKALVGWSRIYDSVYESIDCPDETVVEDNDLLDGWLIVQHRKREAERKKREGTTHSKGLGKAQEVFIQVDTPEDAQRVESLNDAQAKMLKRQRSKMMEDKGVVPEQYMPDSQIKLRAQALREAREAARKK